MDFQAVKGTRDFYPADMRVLNWIMDAWRRVSLRNGFEEYDAPIFEYLDLFTVKSGQEIAEQLFSFEDRGGRKLAIRPEITPSLARMVNAKVNSLPRPMKWFSIPRLCRAERPQRGRLREFFQWNIDIIGSDEVLADAECIFACVDFLREVGLTPQDVQVRIGSRALTTAALEWAGVDPSAIPVVLPVLDKRPKVTPEEFEALGEKAGLSVQQRAAICRFQDSQTIEEVRELLGDRAGVAEQASALRGVLDALAGMGASDYCKLDMRIVRGLAYYTGIVYEVFDAGESLRAIAGGGRYDNLLEVLGGPKMGACGFGMGDVVLGILLEEKGKIPAHVRSRGLDFYVIDGAEGAPAEDLRDTVLAVVGALRRKGLRADFSYKRQALGKQLKIANQRGAKWAAIILSKDKVALKDLTSSSGSQRELPLDDFLKNPQAYIGK